VGHGWKLQVSFYRLFSSTVKESRVCAFYEPFIHCQNEETRNKVMLTGFRAGLTRSVVSVDHGAINLGAGFSFNAPGLRSSIGLDSGRRGDVFMPTGNQLGALGLVEVDLIPVPALGLAVTLGVTTHWIDFNA
jgi:hypothetical protein